MWKKVIPAVALSSLLLVGCNNRDNAIPNNNETPMEDVRNDINTPSPNTNNGMNDNGHGNGTLNDGTINDGTLNNGINDNGTINNGNGNVPNDGKWIKEPGVTNNNDELINNKNNIK
ncbi:hypothetical protein [Psychrobacillus sp. NPDC096623]|uniref:hypothetical protein n=1 Tax=Psychrobacillus sp. NPDC096623 TaxID=3364492 RepID=UPI0037FF34B3